MLIIEDDPYYFLQFDKVQRVHSPAVCLNVLLMTIHLNKNII